LWTYHPTKERIEKKIAELPSNVEILTVRQNAEIVGTLVSSYILKGVREIIGIGIIPGKRNLGFGSMLLKKIRSSFPNDLIILETDNDARDFYLTNSFTIFDEFYIGNRKRYKMRNCEIRITPLITNYQAQFESQTYEVYNRSKIREFTYYPQINSHPKIQDDPEAIESFHKSDKYLAWHQDLIVGFIGVRQNYLSHLYVMPEFCRLGIGTNLLAHIQSPRSSDRFLYTAYGNFAAIKIYEDFGFQITEVAYYKIQGEIIQIVKMQQIGS
jgi:ribosomal protein S18 acetylase RimI-like enzyme